MFGSGMTTLIILNREIEEIMKIVKFLEESGLLTKSVSETIENEAKEWKADFLACHEVLYLLLYLEIC